MRLEFSFSTVHPYLHEVPAVRSDFVCSVCHGPKDPSYDLCMSCHRLFEESGADGHLRDRILPMSISINPSTWYSYLRAYKRGNVREYLPLVVSVGCEWLFQHREAVAALLGGGPTSLCAVPSKKDFDFDTQPLRRGLHRWPPLDLPVRHFVDFKPPGLPDYRYKFFPECFRPAKDNPGGERILLIEDAWATGGTAVSTAAALYDRGAQAVLVLPIARVVSNAYYPPMHPYREAVRHEYRLQAWPK